MRIITISREFGSGGREIGKRLADALGVPCYDHEIIDMVAEQHGFDKNYVAHISEKDIRAFYPSTIAHRFMTHQPAAQQPIKSETSIKAMLEFIFLWRIVHKEFKVNFLHGSKNNGIM